MRVDRAYKGVSDETLVLFDDGMCDGPDLEVGEQYLIYTRRFDNGEVPSRGCTRSRHVKYADEDLKYLNGLGEAVPTGTIFGKVVVRRDDYHGDVQAATGALVELGGPTAQYTTTTDGDGQYSFAGIEPGTYDVTATQPDFRMLTFGYEGKLPSASVEAGGCAVVNVVLRKMWRGAIKGRVVRSNGSPAPPGMDLSLIRVGDRKGEKRSDVLFGSGVSTNGDGEYSFNEVAPGRYKIVMNLYRFPTARAPYPTIYWPAAPSESEALIIEITEAISTQQFNFILPLEPKRTLVNGIVLYPDGKAAVGASVQIEALPDNAIAGDNENMPETDENGHFSFSAFEGFDYRLSASAGWELHSTAVDFSLSKRLQFITLVLDRPTRSRTVSVKPANEDPDQ